MIESPTGMSIMQIYEHYRKDQVFVNRRYQRKLVWTLKEKQNLIDSILLKYPVPLILLTKTNKGFEIIDGMQRLNAFFGFIENEFPIIIDGEEKYFNTNDYTFSRTQISEGKFQPITEAKYITQEQVSDFISYQFPLTVFKSTKIDDINETFRRINSGGRHLSPQEVRQAGNITKFADLVREISAEIRGDSSNNILLLSNMPSISIDTREPLGYGISALDTIWCKHGILRITDLRESEDEQFIADIILSIALEKPFPSSKIEFNNYYGTGDNDKSNEIEIKINALGRDNLAKDIKLVFSEIKSFCDNYLTNENLKKIVNPKAGGNPIKEDFYTIFMAFYQLIINDNKFPFDNLEIKKALSNIHKRLTRDRKYTTTAGRIKNITLCKSFLEPHFKESKNTFRSRTSLSLDFQNYLMRSKVESAIYDFKQGLYTLNPKKREFSEKTFEDKIIKSIAALSNLGKDKKGYLFIGVSDKEEDTAQIEKLDKIDNVFRYQGFGVVGLEREAKLRGVTLDNYITMITDKISKSALPQELLKRVSKTITPITYHNRTILMIEIQCGNSPIYYNDKMYHRDGSNTKEVVGAAQGDIFKLFL
ncbi:DUF262 domain-containing protein [Flavobacterium sp. TP390]|uniref:DUF262 domain-containing protein n=1 Tax=Flavobacterium profundi TaxID=1774945 RepID=A0A6I4IVI4_9FLAO|nr:DUF262 domain-containing protein [Flavobacterium profundi]MVO10881.1 DUF262 domain-containing protein [Flavobacterium profundi]